MKTIWLSGSLWPNSAAPYATSPFVCHIAHALHNAVADPSHKLTVKLEIWPTLVGKKTPNVLRIPVIRIDFRCTRNFPTMPIEFHDTPSIETACGCSCVRDKIVYFHTQFSITQDSKSRLCSSPWNSNFYKLDKYSLSLLW